MKALFVAGTDTGVGKTQVSSALLCAASKAGYRCFGLKPVAAGAELVDGHWRNDDALQLQSCSNVALPYEEVNPLLLRAALSPHLAARAEGREIALPSLLKSCELSLTRNADLVLLEGAGGWLVPLNPQHTMADLAVALQLPVLLVVGLRLGCLNHALLSAAAIRNSGLKLLAWVANQIDPNMDAVDANIATLSERLGAPLLGTVPWNSNISPQNAAAALDINALLALLKI